MRALLAVIFCLLLAGPAWAETRLALLIGNQGYNDAVEPLKNPHRDIAHVAKVLKDLGFAVELLQDVSPDQMAEAVAEYAAKLAKAGENAIGIFYYSGHGVTVGESGVSYAFTARD